jgi:hypothetical protein
LKRAGRPGSNAAAYRRGLELCPCDDCCKARPGRAAIVAKQRVQLVKQLEAYVWPGVRGLA